MKMFVDRLTAAVADYEHANGRKLLKKELAEAAGVSSAAVSLWYKGATQSLKADPVLRLASFLGVRAEWLSEGRGPMKDDELADFFGEPTPYQKKYERASKAVQAAADALLDLPADKQREAVNYIEYLANKH